MRDFLEISNVCLIYLSKVSIILYDISKTECDVLLLDEMRRCKCY